MVVISKVRGDLKPLSDIGNLKLLGPQFCRHFRKGLLVNFLGNCLSSLFYFASRDVVSFVIISN